MAVGDAYKARMAEKRAIGANRGDLEGSKAADAEGAEVERIEDVAADEQKPSKRKRMKRHLARFWCCYLLAGIIFLAIFLPVFFLVAIPAIAQRLVEDTNLPVYGADITDPKPDAVTFTLNTGLKIPLPGVSVKLKAFDLNLFNRDSDPEVNYLTIPVPDQTVKGKTNISVTSEDTPVLDEDEFVKSLTKAVYSKRFTLSAIGKTTAYIGALKAGITLDKDVELDGLDQLSGFSIDEAALLLPAMSNGSNLRGKATLPNHSVVTFALGNVTLNLKSEDIILGTALLPDVVLQPGNNSVAFTGIADVSSAISNIGPILSSQKESLRNGEIALSASGNQTVYAGEHIPYFERVLNDLTITASVPLLQIVTDTLGDFLGEGSDGVIDAVTDIFNKMDFKTLFKDVDFDSLFDYVGNIINNLNLGQLVKAEDLNVLLKGIDWSKVAAGVGSILSQLDLGDFLESIDFSGLLQSIDWNSLLQGVADLLQDIDWDALSQTLNTILESVDWSALSEQIQPVLDKLDLNSILSNIDFGAIFDNLGPLLEKVDFGAIFENLDWGAVINGVGSLLKNVDLSGLVDGFVQGLKSLNLGSILDQINIGDVNVGEVLGGLADNSNATSLDEAVDNFRDVVDDIAGRNSTQMRPADTK